ncbi:SEL1-like repeat protein [Jeongeupia chitinilytica]|uniref:DUF6396 domain-containing protein n=1 Tax=Jeongeupia chitinilytica TaxID=1041641 RepID=A0ABQ3GZ67_9NEIS|nr:sel1 repeat family protein [Jeongeupia chitinilytica]GHD59585.1 hypothetical protein GCM10007350_11290 [Jeongeupia chitinilytica]
MIKPTLLTLALCLGLNACKEAPKEIKPMFNASEAEAKLAFTCVHQKLPELDPDADKLYRYARWLTKNQVEKEDPTRYPEMERLYRIATAHGHYKANLELRKLIGEGHAFSDNPAKETIDLTQVLIDRGIPGGYYDMAIYLGRGYGVKQDSDLARQYYRKAADLGDPDAQYFVGDKLTDLDSDVAYTVGREMTKCAGEQGHGEAAVSYGIYMKNQKKYSEAVKFFHLAAKAGNESGAGRLDSGFAGTPPDDKIYYLALPKDEERSRRYKAIWSVLSDYSYAHPSVPELDDIVPLPPAKLPPWDGKLKWLVDFEANIPPEKPSEALLEKMAKAKGLDPVTGRPLAQPAKTSQADPEPAKPTAPTVALGTLCRSGDACPQSGMWQVIWPDEPNVNALTVTRHFTKGEPLPMQTVERQRSGLASVFKGKTTSQIEPVSWRLVGLG